MGAIAAAMLFTAAVAFAAMRVGVVESSRDAIRSGTGTIAVLRDPALDDFAKERQLQKLSVHLMALFCRILLQVGLAFAGPVLVLLLLDYFGVMKLAAVERASLSWPLLAFYGMLLVGVPLLKRQARGRQGK